MVNTFHTHMHRLPRCYGEFRHSLLSTFSCADISQQVFMLDPMRGRCTRIMKMQHYAIHDSVGLFKLKPINVTPSANGNATETVHQALPFCFACWPVLIPNLASVTQTCWYHTETPCTHNYTGGTSYVSCYCLRQYSMNDRSWVWSKCCK